MSRLNWSWKEDPKKKPMPDLHAFGLKVKEARRKRSLLVIPENRLNGIKASSMYSLFKKESDP